MSAELVADALREIRDELCGIRVALEVLSATPAAATERPACQHPEAMRVDFSAGAIEEWECSTFRGGCGFRYVGQVSAEG